MKKLTLPKNIKIAVENIASIPFEEYCEVVEDLGFDICIDTAHLIGSGTDI